MKFFEKEKLEIIKNKIIDIKNINILELGVQRGNSTKMFLELCEQNNGQLTSIDIEDCSYVSNNEKWEFIHSSDDNFDFISEKIIKKGKFDIIFIDSLHEHNHVKKVFYYYFNYLKIGGIIILDDISWLPYSKNQIHDNNFSEIINRNIFEKTLEIFNSNRDNLTLEMNFNGFGLAFFVKIGTELNEEIKIKNRSYTIKNLIKKFIYNPKPKK